MPNLNNSGIALPRFESADVTLFYAHAGSQLAETDKQSSETLSVASFLSGPAFGVLKPGHLGKAVVDFCEVAQHRLDLGYRL